MALKAGDGASDCPAWEGESYLHYMWRLAKQYGWRVEDVEPPVMQADVPGRAAQSREPGQEG